MSPHTNSLLKDLRLLFAVYRGASTNRGKDKTLAPRVAVIMGAQILKGGRPSPVLEARVRHAARLYAGGAYDLLIPTGGLGEHPPREADLMMNLLMADNVPPEAILPEDAAANTWDSAIQVARIARQRDIEWIAVVTDPLHCVRSIWSFEAAGLNALAEPVYESPMWQKPWSRRGQLAREVAALVWYRWRYRRRLVSGGSRVRP